MQHGRTTQEQSWGRATLLSNTSIIVSTKTSLSYIYGLMWRTHTPGTKYYGLLWRTHTPGTKLPGTVYCCGEHTHLVQSTIPVLLYYSIDSSSGVGIIVGARRCGAWLPYEHASVRTSPKVCRTYPFVLFIFTRWYSNLLHFRETKKRKKSRKKCAKNTYCCT